MSDNPANPFADRHAGEGRLHRLRRAHDHGVAGRDRGDQQAARLRLLVSAAGGSDVRRGEPGPGDGYQNMANPYDEDPGSPNSPLHGVIQVVEVPLNNPAASQELDVQPKISYPGDPDGKKEWCEKGLCSTPASPLEAAAVACHDIVTMSSTAWPARRARSRAQVWEIDRGRHPDDRGPDARRRRRGQRGRQRPDPRGGRLLPLGDVQQRRHRGELGRRVVRVGLPDDDDVPTRGRGTRPAGRTRPAGCSSPTWRGTS